MKDEQKNEKTQSWEATIKIDSQIIAELDTTKMVTKCYGQSTREGVCKKIGGVYLPNTSTSVDICMPSYLQSGHCGVAQVMIGFDAVHNLPICSTDVFNRLGDLPH